jgi:16S rRNA processing protein RimM
VYVVQISDDPHRFDDGARLIHDTGRELIVESSHQHGDRFLVKFAGVDSREAAEEIRGALHVPASEARSLDDDEFWAYELEGCAVELGDGTSVGSVLRVVPGPAQDLLAIETPVGERLVPVVAEIVVAVDRAGRRIVIDPPEGLLD